MRARLVLVLVIGSVMWGTVPSAHADDPDVSAGPQRFDLVDGAVTKSRTRDDGTAVDGVRTGVPALYTTSCELSADRSDVDIKSGCFASATCGDGGRFYNVWIMTEPPTPGGRRCVEPGEAPGAPAVRTVTPSMVVSVFRRTRLPQARLLVQPPGGETLVNFDTLFRTEAESFSRVHSMLGRRVELEISPVRFVWRFGDGVRETTSSPGRAYVESLPMSAYVSHRYEEVGTVEAGVRTVWSCRYRVDGGPWRQVAATVPMDSPLQALDVLEARPKLNG